MNYLDIHIHNSLHFVHDTLRSIRWGAIGQAMWVRNRDTSLGADPRLRLSEALEDKLHLGDE